MEACEYLLKVDGITDTCVAAENQRWYRVKWKSMWISDKVISPEIFQKTQNGKVHIIGNNTSYEILDEKMKEDGHFDFLLSSSDSWEREDKLKRKFKAEIANYWASKLLTNDLIKIEESSDDEGRSCCQRNNDTEISREEVIEAALPVKDETTFSQCCSGKALPQDLSDADSMVPQEGCLIIESASHPLFPPKAKTPSPTASQSPPSSSLIDSMIKAEDALQVSSCSRPFDIKEGIADESDPPPLKLMDEGPSLSSGCKLPSDRFSPTIIKIEDDYPDLCKDESETVPPLSQSVSVTTGVSYGVVKIEEGVSSRACQYTSTTQDPMLMTHANFSSAKHVAPMPPGKSFSSVTPIVIKIEDDEKEEPTCAQSSDNKFFNSPAIQNHHLPFVSQHIPQKFADMSLHEQSERQHNKANIDMHLPDVRYPIVNGHPPNSPPPLISVTPHSPNGTHLSHNGIPAYRRHSAEADKTIAVSASGRMRTTPPDRPPFLVLGDQQLPRNHELMSSLNVENNGHRINNENTDKNKYQMVITNGSHYKCEICGQEFLDFNEVCEHRKSHRSNSVLPPIKIEDESDFRSNNDSENSEPPFMAANSNYRARQPVGDGPYQTGMEPRQSKAYNPQLPSPHDFRVQTRCNIPGSHVVYSSPDHPHGNTHGSLVMPQHIPMGNSEEHFFSKSYPPPNPISYVNEYAVPPGTLPPGMRNKADMFKPALRERSSSSLDSYLTAAGQISPHRYLSMPSSPDKGRTRPLNGMVDPHYYSRPKGYMMTSDHIISNSHAIRKSLDFNPIMTHDKLPYQIPPGVMANAGARRPLLINRMELNRFPIHPGDYINPHVRPSRYPPPPTLQAHHNVPDYAANNTQEKQLANQRMQMFHSLSPVNVRGFSDVAARHLRPPLQGPSYYPPANYPNNRMPTDVPLPLTKMPANYPPINSELLIVQPHNSSPQKRQISPPRYPTCDFCGKHFADFITLNEHRATHNTDQVIIQRLHIKEEPDKNFAPSTSYGFRSDVPPELVYQPQDQLTPEKTQHSPVNSLLHQRSPVSPMSLTTANGQGDNQADPGRHQSIPNGDNLDEATAALRGSSPRLRAMQQQQQFMQNNDITCNTNPSMVVSSPNSFLPTNASILIDGSCPTITAEPVVEVVNVMTQQVNHTPSIQAPVENSIVESALEKIHKCDICKVTFEDYSRLKEHRKIHVGEKQFSCDLCDKTFTQNSTLKRHQRTHTREKPYKCEICSKSFSHNYNLKEHGKTHTGEKPYKCEICFKTFAQNYHLKEHQTTHSDAKPFKCDKCNKQFSLDSYLKKHQKIHTGEKPYKCDVCDKQFLQNSHLKDHRRIHTGEKPFRCEICGIRFSQNYTLKIHQRTHTGEKPYKCEVCQKRFSQNSHLKEHRTRTHSGDKPFKCDQCHKEFSLDSYLKKHQKIHSGEKPFKCDICSKQFSQNYHLKEHRRIHTGEKPYKCQICEMRFSQNCSLKIHQRIHTGEKPYECEICGKQFSHSSNVKTHKRVHMNEKSTAISHALGNASKPAVIVSKDATDVTLTNSSPVHVVQPTAEATPT